MGELLEALFVCKNTVSKIPVLVMWQPGTVSPEVNVGERSNFSAEMEIGVPFVFLYLFGGGNVLDESGA